MVKTDKLIVGYGSHPLAPELSFEISRGQCVLLAGPNGCGKTTLLRTLAGLIRPLGGSFSCSGSVSYLPSRIEKVRGFTALEFAMLLSSDSDNEVMDMLSLMGMSAFAYRDISSLSDGEFQKICIAAAMAGKCEVLLLDEPTSFLDVNNRLEILSLLRSLAHEKCCTVIFSSHDVNDALNYIDRVLAFSASGLEISEAERESCRKTLLAAFPALRTEFTDSISHSLLEPR